MTIHSSDRAPVPVEILLRLAAGNANLNRYHAAVAAGAHPQRWLQRFFDDHDVVLVIYRDPVEPCGLAMLNAKGRHLIREHGLAGIDRKVGVGTIVLQDATTAWVAGVVHGDMNMPGPADLQRMEVRS